MRCFAVWMRFGDHLTLVDTSENFPELLFFHLTLNPPSVGGDTHLARFARQRTIQTTSGCLENQMPGSKFTHYCFQRIQADACKPKVVLIVAWYWTQ